MWLYICNDGKSSWLAVWLGISTPNTCNGIVHLFLDLWYFSSCRSMMCASIAHFLSGIFFRIWQKKGRKGKRRKAWVMIDATQLNVSVMHNVFPCYFSQVKSAQSNKAICNYNNMCWSDMLKVIQHVYIMPSSGWGGLNAWQLWSTL